MVEKGNENCAISIFLEAFLFCFMIVSPIAFYMRFETPPKRIMNIPFGLLFYFQKVLLKILWHSNLFTTFSVLHMTNPFYDK